jgi:tetratricopeptide (TPR) repeat protein
MDSVLFFTKVALSYNDQLDEAYIIRGNYYHEKGSPEQAIKEYDKALKINPNSWRAYSAKADLSDTLLISLKNLQKAASLNHGSELPDILRLIAYVYCDAGFTEKSKYYSLEAFKLDGDSVKNFTQLGYLEHKLANYEKSVEFLERSYKLDTTNLSTLQDLVVICGFAGQMEKSLKYCKEFVSRREALFGTEYSVGAAINHRIGYAYWKNGYKKESEYYFNKQLEECNNQIKSIRPWSQLYYTYYDIAGVYAFRGDKVKAYENLKNFNQRKVEPLWMLSLIKNDPLFNSMRNEPEFQQIVRDTEAKYQAEHERVRKWLEEQGKL